MEKDCTKLKIEDIVELANHGNAEAEYELGYRFHNGLDVEQNRAEALKWFLKASRKGNADAALAAAETYYWGRGVRRDRERSQWFFLEACSCFDRDYKSGRHAGYSAFRIYAIKKAGTYAFSVESLNASKGGDAYYSVAVNQQKSSLPKASDALLAAQEACSLDMPEISGMETGAAFADSSLGVQDDLSFGQYGVDASLVSSSDLTMKETLEETGKGILASL